ncbi:hypothetical protein FRB94_003287 [Tulasnella sp. JGI-2019a]|nr:hypothetical protein FRB94_003287 [Tulasnella sp. JGI-2019a]
MDENLKLDRRIVDETLEELDFLFIDNDPTKLVIDKSAPLGAGGAENVYEADLSVALAQQTIRVAVKILRSHATKDLRVAYRLLREISVWADLRHQNILPLIGFYLSPELDVAFLLCPLEPHGSVEHYLHTHPIDIPARMELVAQVARGIAYLHTLNPPVTHGDIKAANTLVNQQGEAMLCDFGLAKSNFRSGLETSNGPAGTIRFCSPELFDEVEQSPASDMWALGCLAVEIILDEKPFASIRQAPRIIKMIVDGKLPSSKETLRSHPDLWDGVSHCWHFEAGDRIHAPEFLSYWDLKIRDHATEGPACPCTHRQQLLIDGDIMPEVPNDDASESTNDGIKPHDEGPRGALRALEALPQAKFASWSAISTRVSCLAGTRTAVLKEIRAWLANTSPNSPLFFDLDGIAGIGKTTIAHTLAEEAARDGYLGASFFFSRGGEPKLSNPTLVFSTLAYQLAHFDPSFLLHFGRAAEIASGEASESLATQLQRLIIEPLRRVTPPSKPLLIVLDAIDECQKQGAKELLRSLLSEVPKVPLSLKIFMTSRPEPHLRSIFNHAGNLHKLILHDIEASIVKNDIRLYLKTSFAGIPGRLDLPIGRGWARLDEIEALVERSETLFIVAVTFARFAGDYEAKNPRQQLDLLLERSESSFTGPNHTVDELYLQILRKIRATTGSPHIIERLQLIVGTVVLLRNPISITAMERLLGLSVGDGSRALHHLHSVISIPRSAYECPRIHHASFPDFITDPLRCTESEFYIQKDIHEARLAKRCFGLVIFAIESRVMKQRLEQLRMQEWQWIPPRVARSVQEEENLEQKLERWKPLELPEWRKRQAQQMRQTRKEQIKRRAQQSLGLEDLMYALSSWWYHSSQGAYDNEAANLLELSISRYLMWWFEAIYLREPIMYLTEESSWAILSRAKDLASMFAAFALNAGDPRKAVEVIEHVQSASAVQLAQYQTTLHKLHASSPELVSELFNLSSQLQRVTSEGEGGAVKYTMWPDTVESYHDLSKRWNDVLARIRKLPGFETFLKPTRFEILQHAAAQGPVIILNVTQLRSDAIIILKAGEPTVIPLPKATPDAIESLLETPMGGTSRWSALDRSPSSLKTKLQNIWTVIVAPVVNYLERTLRLPHGSRVWWNPAVAVCSLPLHAAQTSISHELGLSDRFVSSYTPSLSVLLRSGAPAMRACGPELLLMTPTAHVVGVTDIIPTGLQAHITVIEGVNSTKGSMLSGLKSSTWVHFTSDNCWFVKDSFKSTIILQSRDAEPLTFLDIVRNDFPTAELAFLSVGHSADGDEGNHLAAGMLLSGFRSVIGSMWDIADEDRLVVAREFYKYMFRNGPEAADYKDAAMAMNVATQELRRMGVPLDRWINLVHYGI